MMFVEPRAELLSGRPDFLELFGEFYFWVACPASLQAYEPFCL